MKPLNTAGVLIALLGLPHIASAWHVEGEVACDKDLSGQFSPEDGALAGVVVNVSSTTTSFTASAITDENGYYFIDLPDVPDVYTVTLDASTLPSDATIVIPASQSYMLELTDAVQFDRRHFLIDSATCQSIVSQACWMTGGGVKFESVVSDYVAEHGPRDSLGGNVFPSCSSEPGNGGQWNHVAHSLKLHFLGTDIHTVRCGNVPGIPAGSESPVTPYNYIEFEGTGVLSGIKGNKFPKTPVSFFARVEDRNEPGSNGASDGEDIDRYYIRVYEGDGVGTTHLLVDQDGDAGSVDPVQITGGNLQLHISSCDSPPNF